MCVCVCVCVHARTLSCSVVSNSATPWTVALQAPLSMGFPRQEYWSGLPFLLQGIFLTQGLNLGPLHCRQILYHMSHKEYMCVCVCVCVSLLNLLQYWICFMLWFFWPQNMWDLSSPTRDRTHTLVHWEAESSNYILNEWIKGLICLNIMLYTIIEILHLKITFILGINLKLYNQSNW